MVFVFPGANGVGAAVLDTSVAPARVLKPAKRSREDEINDFIFGPLVLPNVC